MNKLKKTLALLLSLVMILSLLPAAAFAAEDELPEEEIEEISELQPEDAKAEVATGSVAEVNGNGYPTLAEAYAAANPGDTITLLADISESVQFYRMDETLTTSDEFTLDFNGHTIYGNLQLCHKHKLVIKDSSEDHTGGIIVSSGYAIEFPSVGNNGCKGKVEITGGTIRAQSNYAIYNKKIAATSAIIINGENVNIISDTKSAVYSDKMSSVIEIHKGTLQGGTNGSGLEVRTGASTVRIYGGTITGGQYGAYIACGVTYFSISGGTFRGGTAGFNCTNTKTKFITGGTFSSEPDSKFIADGYKAVAQGTTPETWTVQPITYVAQIGEEKYETLAEAVATANAAEEAVTITLLADVAADRITISKSLTLDLGGKTYTGRLTIDNGTVTVQNGTVVGRFDAYDSATVTLAGTATVNGQAVVWGSGIYGQEGCKTPTLNVYGTISNTGDSAISTNGTDKSGAIINIYDDASVTSEDEIGIYLPSGNLTISGGTITGTTGVYVKSGTLNITGGTIIGNGAKAAYSYNGNGANATGDALVVESCGYPNGAPTATINGGTFTSNNGNAIGYYEYLGTSTELNPATVTATSNDLTIPAGYMWVDNNDGTWTVKFKYSTKIVWNAETDKDIRLQEGVEITNLWIMLGDKTSGFKYGTVQPSADEVELFATVEDFLEYLVKDCVSDETVQGYMDQYGVVFLRLKYDSIVWPTVDTPAESVVCSVDSAEYHSVKEAVDAIANSSKSGTIKMVADYTTTCAVIIPEDVNVTLDLDGHTLTGGAEASNRSVYAIENFGTFTLKDSGNNGAINARGILNETSGTMTIEGGIVTNVDTNGGAALFNEGNLEVNGGTFRATHVGSANDSSGPACLTNNSGATAVIKEGTFTSASNRTYAVNNYGNLTIQDATVSGAHGALSCNSGTLVVNDGSYTATNYYGLWITNDGNITDVTVKGGTFQGGSVGKNALRASVDDGKQDCSDATIRITGGTFIGNGGSAAAVALNKSGSAHSWGMNITGGVFSTNPDSSYVAEGYEAVVLGDSNRLENETVGYYKVGEVTVTAPQPTAATPNYDATYIADKAVNSTDGSEMELASSNTVTVNIKATGNSVAAANPATSYDLASVVADAIKVADTPETNLNVDIQIVSKPVEDDTANNTVTYEVHPEATVTVGDTKVGTFQVSNEQLNNASFTITLSVPFAADYVDVVHTHADGTEEKYYALAVEGGKVTITGVTSFSEFSISDAADSKTEFKGAALRRRVYTSDRDTVVDFETDIRFEYRFTLPVGATFNKEASKFYYQANVDTVGDNAPYIAVNDYVYNSNTKEYTVYLTISKVNSKYFDSRIATALEVSYTLGGITYTRVKMVGETRTVNQVRDGLIQLLAGKTDSYSVRWYDYARFLKGDGIQSYRISDYADNN